MALTLKEAMPRKGTILSPVKLRVVQKKMNDKGQHVISVADNTMAAKAFCHESKAAELEEGGTYVFRRLQCGKVCVFINEDVDIRSSKMKLTSAAHTQAVHILSPPQPEIKDVSTTKSSPVKTILTVQGTVEQVSTSSENCSWPPESIWPPIQSYTSYKSFYIVGMMIYISPSNYLSIQTFFC